MIRHAMLKTLRGRTIGTLMLLLAGLVFLVAHFADKIILTSFANLEKRYMREHVERLEKAYARDLAGLASIAEDWGPWDDTYSFMHNFNEEYITNNLTESVFENLRLHVMVFLDPSGATVYAAGANSPEKAFRPVPQSLLVQLEQSGLFTSTDPRHGGIAGMIMLPEGPIMVASYPILTSVYTGPARGHLVVGRFLDGPEIARYAEQLMVNITISSPSGSDAPDPDPRLPGEIQVLGKDSIGASTVLADLFGRPAVILTVVKSRDIGKLGSKTTRYFIFALAGAGLSFTAAMLVFLEKNILSRLDAISAEVKTIGNAKSFSARLKPEQSSDELAIVAEAINDMLDKLEQSQRQSQQAYADLQASEALKSSIIEAIPDILIRFDREGRYLDILTREESTLDRSRNQMLGKTVADILPEQIAKQYLRCIRLALHSGRLQTFEYGLDTAAGKMEFEARMAAGSNYEVVAFIREITESKRATEQLKYLSLHDQLTGLFNRAYFDAELKRLNDSRDHPISIICADLDRLKLINDTMGHDQGDHYLKAAAAVLKQSLRASDILCRVGGDEFVVILPHTGAETAAKVAARIRENLDRYNREPGGLPLGISLGMAAAEDTQVPLKDLYKQADDLMYKDKFHRGARG